MRALHGTARAVPMVTWLACAACLLAGAAAADTRSIEYRRQRLAVGRYRFDVKVPQGERLEILSTGLSRPRLPVATLPARNAPTGAAWHARSGSLSDPTGRFTSPATLGSTPCSGCAGRLTDV